MGRILLAVAFPALVVGAAWALLPPAAILEGGPGAAGAVDRSPLPYRTHLAWTLPYLALAFALDGILAAAQRRLFAAAERGSWLFSERTSDSASYSLVVMLFVGLVAAFPIAVRALRARYGDRIHEVLDRGGRDRSGLSLRQEIAVFPRLAMTVALMATLMNAVAFDSCFQVGDRIVRYSPIFSAGAREIRVEDVEEVVVYPSRLAPIGRVTGIRSVAHRPFLVVRLRDGSRIDTRHVVDSRNVQRAAAALQAATGGRVPIVHAIGAG